MAKVFLFPGQGSQFVGMGSDLFAGYPAAAEFYSTANETLGFDIGQVSFTGPEDTLKETQFTQPAIFVHSMIVDTLLKMKGEKPQAVAGHSLGEFSALVSAGVIQFKDALRIVKIRSEEMALAGSQQPGSMAAILGASPEQLAIICDQDGIVVPANLNAPGQVVISGEVQAVAQAIEKAKSIGIRRALPLNVSGAFHSPLMASARGPLADIINAVEFREPLVPVYQNVTAKPTTAVGEIKANILNQLESPVRWSDTITAMKADGFRGFLEVGPGKVLTGLQRRIDRELHTIPVGTLEEVNNYEV